MSSLHSALEMWTVLANRSVQEGTGQRVEFGHYYCAVCLFFYDTCLLGQRKEKRSLLFFSSPKNLLKG